MNFIEAMKITEGVLAQYKIDQLKWWKRLDGTPMLNDLAVLFAEAFMKASTNQPVQGNALTDDLYILSTNEEAMEEAIQRFKGSSTGEALKAVFAAQKSLRALLASQPSAQPIEQEPAAWIRITDITELTDSEPETDGWTPLYAIPQPSATGAQGEGFESALRKSLASIGTSEQEIGYVLTDMRKLVSAPADVAAVRDAALAVVNAALEGAEDNVHVCDRNNVEAKLQTIQPQVVALYRALKSAAPTANDVPGFIPEAGYKFSRVTAQGLDEYGGHCIDYRFTKPRALKTSPPITGQAQAEGENNV